ncbi:Galactose oxidase, central domain/Kelch motif containing protein, putative [Leishmania guyanensis]
MSRTLGLPTMLAPLPLSNLAASTPHSTNSCVMAPTTLTMVPSLSLENDFKRVTEDPNCQRSGGGAVGQDNHAPAVSTRSLIGVCGSVLPEKKGGLPKAGHIGVCYRQDLYVFGGVNSKGQFSNHVFCHEKRTLLWRETRGIGVVPRGRANHAGVLIGSKIYIHGGHRQLEVFDDLFAYEVETTRWEKIACERSQGPGPVFLHAMVYIPPLHSLLVLGGIHQREQNSWLGHLFDLRNRVWTGVPPPPSVSAQHLQLVTVAYHAPSAMVVVLGLMEMNVLEDNTAPTPHVHLFQPSTFLWRRVETRTAPESPLPFCMEDTWEPLLHILIPGGGGVYDPFLESWMFPLPSTVTDDTNDDDALGQRPSKASVVLPPVPQNKYGFLVLDLRRMSWSLVSCNVSRKLVAKLNAVNRVTREKMERIVMRNPAAAAALALAGSSSHSNSPVHQPVNGGSVLGLSRTSLDHGASGVATRRPSGFRHQPSQWQRHSSSSTSLPWARASATRTSMGSGNTDSKTAALLSASRYRRLFFFDDAPEFMRKYTLVAVRDEAAKSGRLRPLQYVVLHGGLTEPTDYAMLMFTPMVTWLDANGAVPAGGTCRKSRSDSLCGQGAANLGSWRGSACIQSFGASNDDYEDEDFDDDASLVCSGASTSARTSQRDYRSTVPYAPPREVEGLIHSRAGRDSDEDEDDVNGEEQLNSGGAMRRSFLLPTLQCGRTSRNYCRFALQFAPGNSVQKESLLPYLNIPVAVLQTPGDVQKWSRHYYTDQRRWLSGRLKDALLEDRKLRRLRQVNKARQAQMTTVSGAGTSVSLAGSAAHEDESNDELESFMEGLYFMESLTGDPRTHSGANSSGLLANEDQLSLDAAAAAVTRAEAQKKRVCDFFEEHGLDVFDEDRDLQSPQGQTQMRTTPTKLSGNEAKHDGRQKDPRPKERTAVAEGANEKATKRSEASPLVPNSGAPDAFVPLVSESQMADPCFERLRTKVRQDGGRERMAVTLFHDLFINGLAGGAPGAALDFRNLAAYTLLKGLMARLRADGDLHETHRRRAQLRWRFLRAVVRTGEAVYLLYLASQADFKMKGTVVTGTPSLLLAPDLYFVGPSQAYRVPCKPVPYNLAASSAPPLASSSRLAQVTASGMVVYHSLK